MCAELEQAGLLHRDSKRRYVLLKSPAELIEGTRDLARRFENLKEQDEKRLLAMQAYATSEECRGQFIRRWFGEQDPPECGRCDRCRAETAAHAEPEPDRDDGKWKRRRGKRRRRSRGKRRGENRQRQPKPESKQPKGRPQ